MEVIAIYLIYAIFVICQLVPPFFILRSKKTAGWQKARWVLACPLLAFLPTLVIGYGMLLASKFGITFSLEDLLFGPLSSLMPIANIALLVVPWIVYVVYRERYPYIP